MINALESENYDAFAERYAELLNNCETDKAKKELRSSYKRMVTSEYKNTYYNAFVAENSEEMDRIQTIMRETGLYEDEDNTVESVSVDWLYDKIMESYKSAYSEGDYMKMSEYEDLLVRSGKYKTREDAQARTKKWREAESGK